jgi:hypothetical protein
MMGCVARMFKWNSFLVVISIASAGELIGGVFRAPAGIPEWNNVTEICELVVLNSSV